MTLEMEIPFRVDEKVYRGYIHNLVLDEADGTIPFQDDHGMILEMGIPFQGDEKVDRGHAQNLVLDAYEPIPFQGDEKADRGHARNLALDDVYGPIPFQDDRGMILEMGIPFQDEKADRGYTQNLVLDAYGPIPFQDDHGTISFQDDEKVGQVFLSLSDEILDVCGALLLPFSGEEEQTRLVRNFH
jgi:hypothetical protein